MSVELRRIVLYACGHFGNGIHKEGGLVCFKALECQECNRKFYGMFPTRKEINLAQTWKEQAEATCE